MAEVLRRETDGVTVTMAGAKHKTRQDQKPKLDQNTRQAQIARLRERLQVQNWAQNDSGDLSLPRRAWDCDQTRPPVDQSWRKAPCRAQEAVLADPPKAQWRIVQKPQTQSAEDLEVVPTAHSLVRLRNNTPPREDDFDYQARRAVLEVYVRNQLDFVLSGDLFLLKRWVLRLDEHFGNYTEEFRKKLENLRLTTLVRDQFLYLPNGSLCAAELLYDRNLAERETFRQLLSEERRAFSLTGGVFSLESLKEQMSERLGYVLSIDEVRTLFTKIGVPSDSRTRKKEHAERPSC